LPPRSCASSSSPHSSRSHLQKAGVRVRVRVRVRVTARIRARARVRAKARFS